MSAETGDGAPPASPGTAYSADARSAAQGAIALAALQSLGRLLGMCFVITATRVLSPGEWGRYAIASTLLLAGGWLSDFGTTTVMTKVVSRQPNRSNELLSGTLPASMALGLTAYVGVLVFAAVANYPRYVVVDVAIAGIGLPIDAALTSVLGALDGAGLIARRSLLSFVRLLVITGSGLVAVLVTRSVRPAMVSLAAGPFVALAAAVVVARRNGVWTGQLRPNMQVSKFLLRRAVPFALLGGINVVVLRFDILVLSLVTSRAEVARYDVAVRVIEAVTFVGVVLASPALFILSSRIGRGDITGAQRAFSEATRLGYLLGIPLSVTLVVLHRPIVELLFGAEYRQSGMLLALLGCQLWLAFIAAIQGSLILSGDDLRDAITVFLRIAALTAIVDLVAILSFGSRGAAGAMILIQVAVVLSAARFSRRTLGIRLTRPPLGCVLAAALTAATAWPVLRLVGPISAAIASMAAYLIGLVLTGTVTRRDTILLRSYLSRSG